jgi:GNAT superfamily N-acetyltransferase
LRRNHYFMYFKPLPGGLVIQNTEVRHAEALDALQHLIFPTLSDDERMKAKHYLHHIRLFPEGQFVVLDGERAIGMSTTIRYHLALKDHTFLEISDNLWMNTHEPEGDWLYGMDVGVHPDYRGRGLAREIYRARQETCRRLGLKGQITVGMPNGYAQYAGQMDLDTYYNGVAAGTIKDPTVSAQQKIGFELVRLIHGYLNDPQCGHGGVLMVLPVEKAV